MDADNWSNIAKATEYYTGVGYTYIDTPWMQPLADIKITCPDTDGIFKVGPKHGLVGSAEQSFIAMSLAGLQKGRYISTGPCFRNELVFDNIHLPTFMKTEIFITDFDDEEQAFQQMMYNAHYCLVSVLGCDDAIMDAEITDDGIDILVNGIEVGSYGIREHKHIRWIYGTGLAEPRFSYAKNHESTKHK